MVPEEISDTRPLSTLGLNISLTSIEEDGTGTLERAYLWMNDPNFTVGSHFTIELLTKMPQLHLFS